MAVDNLLWLVGEPGAIAMVKMEDGSERLCFICPECGEPILPEQTINFDHRHQVATGGAHHYNRIRPIHYDPCHKRKSGRDSKARAKIRHIRGENKPKMKRPWPAGRKMQSRGFEKSAKTRA